MSHGGALLLAAGFSRRFGSDKRRHALGDGTPMLIASLRLYAAAFAEVLVVLRPEDDALAALVAAEDAGPATVITTPDAELGMGHSLARGAAAAAGWDYLFVALGDMAWVRPGTLATLRSSIEGGAGDRIVLPCYQGSPGHPVGFAGRYQAALSELHGDEGARSVVRAAGNDLIRLDVDDPGILEDLDTPPDEP